MSFNAAIGCIVGLALLAVIVGFFLTRKHS